jgi:non-specific serine/threonine protein kinase
MKTWGTGGILADDMGLGKTVQVIAALCDFYVNKNELRPSLIVLPTSLLHNWKHELERFAPHLKFLIHHGLEREAINATAPPVRTIIITSYAILRNEIETLSQILFGYAILDESQAIKNPLSQAAVSAYALSASHRLALTGTPIENNLMDLWSQFAFVSPGILGSQQFFKKEFVEPLQNAKRGPEAIDLLGRMTAPFYLRRTKEKVLPDLPPLEERVLYVDMGTAQRALYNVTRDKFRDHILGTIKTKGINKSQIYIIEGMLRLRQIACDPRLYLPNSKIHSAKLELLVDKLREDVVENHKALVFSQFTTLLDYCGKALDAEKIPFAYLDGSTRDRGKVIEEFTSQSDKRLFLISLKAGGTGLNLTSADYVFHLDPWWNPAVEAQATGRAHRIGQNKAVQSIKLVASDTIEEKILLLQDKKRQLASAVLQSDQGFVKSLDADLVRELFS